MSLLFSLPAQENLGRELDEYRARLARQCEDECPADGSPVLLADLPTPSAESSAQVAAATLAVPRGASPLVAANLIRAAASEAGIDVRVVTSAPGTATLTGDSPAFLVTIDESGTAGLSQVIKAYRRLAALPRDADGFLIG